MNNQNKEENRTYLIKSESRSTPKVSAVSFIHFLSRLAFLILCWAFSIFRTSYARVFSLSNISSSIDSSGYLECISISQSQLTVINEKKVTSTETAKKRLYNPSLVWSRHEHAEPLLHSTSGSSISVNIRIGRSRYLKMNDVIYSGNIKTTSSNIRDKDNGVWGLHESRVRWNEVHGIRIFYSSVVDAILTESAMDRHWYWAARQGVWVFGCHQSTIRPAICQDIEVISNIDTHPGDMGPNNWVYIGF